MSKNYFRFLVPAGLLSGRLLLVDEPLFNAIAFESLFTDRFGDCMFDTQPQSVCSTPRTMASQAFLSEDGVDRGESESVPPAALSSQAGQGLGVRIGATGHAPSVLVCLREGKEEIDGNGRR